MMEIINLQLGGCGNFLGSYFWEVISAEHGLEKDCSFSGEDYQLEYINVYFEEDADKRYKARAILVDLDSCGSIPEILCKERGSLFKQDNIVFGIAGTNYNWALGYHSIGAQRLNQVLDVVRKEAEACDCMQGIQIVHSLGGGTGGGFGSLLAECMIDDYPNRILKSYAVLPMMSNDQNLELRNKIIKFRQYGVTSYNVMLTIPYMINCIHEVVCMDNKTLVKICHRLKQQGDCDNINKLMSSCMSGITARLRFPCRFNTNLQKFHVDMVPFQRMHFFVPGHVPLTSANMPRWKWRFSVRQMFDEVFKRKNMFVECTPKLEKFLTATIFVRGPRSQVSSKKVDEEILQIQNKPYFIDWIPKNLKTDICHLPYDTQMSVTSLSNTTAIQEPFTELYNRFQEMFKKKEHIHFYTKEGVEESDFQKAHETMLSLISEYQQHQKALAETDFVEEFITYED